MHRQAKHMAGKDLACSGLAQVSRGEIKPRWCMEGTVLCCVSEGISVELRETTIRRVKPDGCLTGLR